MQLAAWPAVDVSAASNRALEVSTTMLAIELSGSVRPLFRPTCITMRA